MQLIHSDTYGPTSAKAQTVAPYFITFIDDFTHFGHLYLIIHKSDALDHFRLYVSEVENQLGKSVKALTIDRGREYL